ncbi:PstS family phosphate ABC transporter substrate-binding protein [Paenibacillus sp.]|uniref:PstS family phosphate ABC transporter substrate-binding protein n=1 Tax=Paenibacillus sp. TaxID=58172 RepID=UPI002D5530DE|nr:PstS family phosphate ABC transporter substrate-binding protein [Paenibacillus sp.]HZG83535.1 PstS family phosphate ABC transporter substrate-binding protein [Paenibacillus sp.]
MSKEWLRKGSLLLVSVVLMIVVAACGGGNAGGDEPAQDATQGATTETPTEATPAEETGANLTGDIKLEGSSTVYPISEAVAEEFMAMHEGVNVTVGLSGSSNGIKAIINGEADIANASRLIKDKEVAEIQAKGDDVVEMPVAYDGITVVIHPENDWATEMTVEELQKIWQKDSTIKKWNEVRPEWPDQPITLFGPGTASGTFEYFTEAINGEAKVSREDYTPSEDDNVLVQGVSGDKYALGYFGYAYYEENADKLKAVAIKETADAPAVAPSIETIGNGSYKPLSRMIYIYPLKSALERPEVQEFIKFYMSEEGGQTLSEEVGYVRLGQDLYDKNLSALPQ